MENIILFLDPVGSLVSTLLVVGWWVTLFLNVRLESVILEECNNGKVLVCW